MTLPIKTSYRPMEAELATELPKGPLWQYEPKWDGFRCLAFRDGGRIQLQSKSQKPLSRYFPELIDSLAALKAKSFVLDGEIVIPVDGHLSFDKFRAPDMVGRKPVRFLLRDRGVRPDTAF